MATGAAVSVGMGGVVAVAFAVTVGCGMSSVAGGGGMLSARAADAASCCAEGSTFAVSVFVEDEKKTMAAMTARAPPPSAR